MRVADYIFESLINQGVDKVFSVSGRGALFLTDAVARAKDRIEYVGMHHEQFVVLNFNQCKFFRRWR